MDDLANGHWVQITSNTHLELSTKGLTLWNDKDASRTNWPIKKVVEYFTILEKYQIKPEQLERILRANVPERLKNIKRELMFAKSAIHLWGIHGYIIEELDKLLAELEGTDNAND